MDTNILKASLPEIMTVGNSYYIDVVVRNDLPRDVQVEIELATPMKYLYQEPESTRMTLRPGERRLASFRMIPHKFSDSSFNIQISLKHVEGDSSVELQRVFLPIYSIQRPLSQDALLIAAILGIAALSTVLIARRSRKERR